MIENDSEKVFVRKIEMKKNSIKIDTTSENGKKEDRKAKSEKQ